MQTIGDRNKFSALAAGALLGVLTGEHRRVYVFQSRRRPDEEVAEPASPDHLRVRLPLGSNASAVCKRRASVGSTRFTAKRRK